MKPLDPRIAQRRGACYGRLATEGWLRITRRATDELLRIAQRPTLRDSPTTLVSGGRKDLNDRRANGDWLMLSNDEMQLTGGEPGGVRFAHASSFKRRPQLIWVFYRQESQCEV